MSKNYYILRTEPHEWSYADQIREVVTKWDGVRNYQARNNIRKMQIGDLCLFYHTGSERKVVGIVEVVSEAYDDPSDSRFSCADVKDYKELVKPVSLADLKANPKLVNMQFLKQSRLSVAQVTKSEFDEILYMSGTNI